MFLCVERIGRWSYSVIRNLSQRSLVRSRREWLSTSGSWQSKGLGQCFDLSQILNPELWPGGCWGQAMAPDVAQVGRPGSVGQPESPVGPLGQKGGRGPAGAAPPLPELSQGRRQLRAGEELRFGSDQPSHPRLPPACCALPAICHSLSENPGSAVAFAPERVLRPKQRDCGRPGGPPGAERAPGDQAARAVLCPEPSSPCTGGTVLNRGSSSRSSPRAWRRSSCSRTAAPCGRR